MTKFTHNSFFLHVYFNPLHVSSILVLIIRRINCINTTSSMQVGKELRFLPDLHTRWPLTQSDIYQKLHWYNWFSWWLARGCSKHVENCNKHKRKKNCASSCSFTRIIPRCTVKKTPNEFFGGSWYTLYKLMHGIWDYQNNLQDSTSSHLRNLGLKTTVCFHTKYFMSFVQVLNEQPLERSRPDTITKQWSLEWRMTIKKLGQAKLHAVALDTFHNYASWRGSTARLCVMKQK
jgi:hypothetical protein